VGGDGGWARVDGPLARLEVEQVPKDRLLRRVGVAEIRRELEVLVVLFDSGRGYTKHTVETVETERVGPMFSLFSSGFSTFPRSFECPRISFNCDLSTRQKHMHRRDIKLVLRSTSTGSESFQLRVLELDVNSQSNQRESTKKKKNAKCLFQERRFQERIANNQNAHEVIW
jgi:hypothetical protein